MESVNGLYKTKRIRTMFFHVGTFKTVADMEDATAGWRLVQQPRASSALAANTRIEDEATRYATLLNGLRLG